VLKCDHEVAQSQVYSELVANRLAMFLGIPVLVGVPARATASDASPAIRRASRRRGRPRRLRLHRRRPGDDPDDDPKTRRRCRTACTGMPGTFAR
jgi:hypothetical protein